MPRAESVANECTLVKMPDRTKKVPKILSEKHNIDTVSYTHLRAHET